MAQCRSLMAEDNFLCSICLDVFTQPVSIPCGHNFCLHCITDYWVTVDTSFVCPLCKEEFSPRPRLRVNTFIAEMAAKVKRKLEKQCAGAPEQPGNVLCDMCAEVKCAALKSCLVCFMSYCETHLEPHQRISALKKHKLIHPVENLESRICQEHDLPLELFCRVDKSFLCTACKDSDQHKTHKTVSLEEEAQTSRTTLVTEKRGSDEMIQARQQKIDQIQQLVEARRSNAAKALSDSVRVMSSVVEYVKRSQAELTEVIETKQKLFETEAEGVIRELEGEIMRIKHKKERLNQFPISEDHFIFLERFLGLTITPHQVKDWSDVTVDSGEFSVQEALLALKETVVTEIKMLCDPDLKEMKRHAVDVSLDPDTANPFLIVSEDGKQVAHGDRRRSLPSKPGRFDRVFNVFATEGFSSGKFYYETQVRDKTQWVLGVANQSINRKGDIRLSPENGYWTICLRKGSEFTANAESAVKLHVRGMPRTVGVFVAYEEGQVSFYDVDSRAHIFSFTGRHFTETLFPFFSPLANDGGRNSAPLIITPVKYNEKAGLSRLLKNDM